MNNSKNKKILIVDDEKDIRALIKGILEDEKYEVVEAANSTDAFKQIEAEKPNLVVLDIWLQGSENDGMEILETIKEKQNYIPVLMISGHGTIETAVTAIKHGAYDFIEKPFKSDRLILMISRALEMAVLKDENSRLKIQTSQNKQSLIGRSASINSLRTQIEKIAPSNSRVFIKGEAGTGKEIIAREIHEKSLRNNKPFIALNCAALHPERLEEELFGIEKDQIKQKGVLETANGGTVLLDEILDMPLETQGKILRVLQENKFEVAGSHRLVSVDVRFIASTNKDIDAALEHGKFREDLLYRLNVVTLDIPALKNRKDDIPVLANYFLSYFSKQTGHKEKILSSSVERIFKAYSWPGNVRQLKNVAEWITIMAPQSDSNQVEKEQLPPELVDLKHPSTVADNIDNNDYIDYPLREARENFEKKYLIDQVKRFDGNISQTAEFIGMERSALHRKLKSLDISLQDPQNDQTISKSGFNRKTA